MESTVDQLDIGNLSRYLRQRLPNFNSPLQVRKFAGGQSNPTFLLQAGDQRWVLRRKPPGELLKSAHAVDREYRVISALAAHSDVPVARPVLLCDDDSVIGSMFYLMEYVEGRVFWNAALPELSKPERTAIYDEMNRVLVALHSVDIDKAGLGDYGKPGNYFERQISRWSKQYRASETERNESMETLMTWLPANVPPDDGRVALIHGDFRLDNMLFHPTEAKVAAVLDWELSTLGHPFADLAYQCMQLRIPGDAVIPGLGDRDRDSLGIPSEQAYVQRYCERMRIDGIDNWHFYLAFSFFRLAAIVQGVYKRGLEGNASSQKAFVYGELVKPLADSGVALVRSVG